MLVLVAHAQTHSLTVLPHRDFANRADPRSSSSNLNMVLIKFSSLHAMLFPFFEFYNQYPRLKV